MTDLNSFIWAHRSDDPAQLALSAKKHPGIPMAYVAGQVEALAKIRRKIPSWYREGLVFPVPISLEQASSEATARFKSALFSGQKMLDLTGGLGVDASFFALRFEQVFFVEKNQEILAAARRNLEVLERTNVHFFRQTAEMFLAESNSGFDLIYADPARRDDVKGKVYQLQDCSPNILDIIELALGKAPKLLLKTAPFLDIQQALKQLKMVSKAWVLEYDGDCREVLYLLEKEHPPLDEVSIEALVLEASGNPAYRFQFTMAEEQQAEAEIDLPQGFLYEPAPALLKAGAFKSFARRFGLKKLHQHTHLYTSNEFIAGLPARSFQIEAMTKYDKKAVAALVPSGKAHVSTRNFPEKTDVVRQRLALKDGGDVYVFAATVADEKKQILVCSKL